MQNKKAQLSDELFNFLTTGEAEANRIITIKTVIRKFLLTDSYLNKFLKYKKVDKRRISFILNNYILDNKLSEKNNIDAKKYITKPITSRTGETDEVSMLFETYKILDYAIDLAKTYNQEAVTLKTFEIAFLTSNNNTFINFNSKLGTKTADVFDFILKKHIVLNARLDYLKGRIKHKI